MARGDPEGPGHDAKRSTSRSGAGLFASGVHCRKFHIKRYQIILAIYDLALTYRTENRYSESEQLLKKARTLAIGTLGPEDLATVTITESMGVQYFSVGRYSEAEALFKDVLSHRERVQGLETCDTAKTMNNLGGLYMPLEKQRKRRSSWVRRLW